MPDVFHTFFGVSGLLLLNYFDGKDGHEELNAIDPAYALPERLVQKLGLYSQRLAKV